MGLYLDLDKNDVAELGRCNDFFVRDVKPIAERVENIRLYKKENIEINENDLLSYHCYVYWVRFYALYVDRVDELDRGTRYNQSVLGEKLIFSREQYKNDALGFLSNLCRVLYEYNFITGGLESNNNRTIGRSDLDNLADKYHHRSAESQQFAWIRDVMPILIAQYIVTQPNFIDAIKMADDVKKQVDEIEVRITTKLNSSFFTIENEKKEIKIHVDSAKKEINDHLDSKMADVKNIENKILESRKDIENDKKNIEELKGVISNYRSEFNFVGLSQAFTKIKDIKRDELKYATLWYRWLGLAILAAPIITLVLHFSMPSLFSQGLSGLFLLLPLATIELVFLYFFRLSYIDAKSIKTQVLQIDVRLSLCAFIQDYIGYRKRNDSEIGDLFKCFDTMIFSPIQANEGNIPSMFDGSEAIANFLSKVVTGKGQ
ncbi:hypothetical protein CPU03_15935 [Edwardsiella tarda]|nr:hypothetical protein CPU03_15935 [Edwardsiella tarda]